MALREGGTHSSGSQSLLLVGVDGIMAKTDNKASPVHAVILHPACSKAVKAPSSRCDSCARPALFESTSGQEDMFNVKG